MAEKAKISVLKLGKAGSLISHYNEVIEVGIIPAESIDTTGAGDLYAAGFLYGLINNLQPKICGELGALLSGKVIEVIGPKIDESRWEEIKKHVKTLEN